MGSQRTRVRIDPDQEKDTTGTKRETAAAHSRDRRLQRPMRPVSETAEAGGSAASLSPSHLLGGDAPGAQRAHSIAVLQHYQGNAYVQAMLEAQRADAGDGGDSRLVDGTVERLHREKGAGRPLDDSTREQMEQVLNHDLSAVRVHTDDAAARASASLRANAFTMGTEVYFADGRGRDFSSSAEKGLLAHELTHVVQQSHGSLSLTGGRVKMGRVGDSYEREADALADKALGGAPDVQRQEAEEEEEIQEKAESLQRQEAEEEEEIQESHESLQRQEAEEEEEVQESHESLQRQEAEEEEEIQESHESLQRQEAEEEEEVQESHESLQRQEAEEEEEIQESHESLQRQEAEEEEEIQESHESLQRQEAEEEEEVQESHESLQRQEAEEEEEVQESHESLQRQEAEEEEEVQEKAESLQRQEGEVTFEEEEVEPIEGEARWEGPTTPAEPGEVGAYEGSEEEKERTHEENEQLLERYKAEYETYIEQYVAGLEALTTVDEIKNWGPPASPHHFPTPGGEYTVESFWRGDETLPLYYGRVNSDLQGGWVHAWKAVGRQLDHAMGKRAAGSFFLEGTVTVKSGGDMEIVSSQVENEYKIILDSTGLKVEPVVKSSLEAGGGKIPFGLKGTFSLAPSGEMVTEGEVSAGVVSVAADSEGTVKMEIKVTKGISSVVEVNLDAAVMKQGIKVDAGRLSFDLSVGFQGIRMQDALLAITSPGFWAGDKRKWAQAE